MDLIDVFTASQETAFDTSLILLAIKKGDLPVTGAHLVDRVDLYVWASKVKGT